LLAQRHIEAKPQNPGGAKWCFACNHFALVNKENKCECCNEKVITRPRSYHKELVILGKLVHENLSLIEAYIQKPYSAGSMPGFTVRIGRFNMLINLKHIAEYYHLCSTMNYSQFETFIKQVKDNSDLLMPGVKVK